MIPPSPADQPARDLRGESSLGRVAQMAVRTCEEPHQISISETKGVVEVIHRKRHVAWHVLKITRYGRPIHTTLYGNRGADNSYVMDIFEGGGGIVDWSWYCFDSKLLSRESRYLSL